MVLACFNRVEPFGFLRIAPAPSEVRRVSPEKPQPRAVPLAQTDMYIMETSVKKRVDTIVPEIAKALRLSRFKLVQLTSIGSLIYLAMSALAMFARSDLLNVRRDKKCGIDVNSNNVLLCDSN